MSERGGVILVVDFDFESTSEHMAYLQWLDSQTNPVDDEVAQSAWIESRNYHRQVAEREIQAAQQRLEAHRAAREAAS